MRPTASIYRVLCELLFTLSRGLLGAETLLEVKLLLGDIYRIRAALIGAVTLWALYETFIAAAL